MTVFSQIAVLLLLALCAIVFVVLLRNGNKPNSEFGKSIFFRPKSGNSSEGTVIVPKLYIDQLNPETMESVHRFSIGEIPENGLTISRPNAKEGDIILSGSTREAYTVSQKHAGIGIDTDGMFIQDLNSNNKMYQQGGREPVKQLDITDGLVVYLGFQPLKFSFPAPHAYGEGPQDKSRNEQESMSHIYKETHEADFPLRRIRKNGR